MGGGKGGAEWSSTVKGKGRAVMGVQKGVSETEVFRRQSPVQDSGHTWSFPACWLFRQVLDYMDRGEDCKKVSIGIGGLSILSHSWIRSVKKMLRNLLVSLLVFSLSHIMQGTDLPQQQFIFLIW